MGYFLAVFWLAGACMLIDQKVGRADG